MRRARVLRAHATIVCILKLGLQKNATPYSYWKLYLYIFLFSFLVLSLLEYVFTSCMWNLRNIFLNMQFAETFILLDYSQEIDE